MNSEELVASVKSRASFPTSQNLFTQAGILNVLNEEMHSRIIPLMLGVQEEYYTDYIDVDLKDFPIRIPSEAIGQKLRSLMFLHDDGTLGAPIPRVGIENEYVQGGLCYRMQGNSVHLHFYGMDFGRRRARLFYHRRPSVLVSPLEVATIQSSVGDVFTVARRPLNIDVGAKVDVIESRNPFSPAYRNKNVLAVSSSTIQVEGVEEVEPGWVICLAGKTFYPELPLELHELLAQAAAMKILESQGKPTETALATDVYGRMEQNALKLITPRSDGQPKKVLPRRGISAYV